MSTSNGCVTVSNLANDPYKCINTSHFEWLYDYDRKNQFLGWSLLSMLYYTSMNNTIEFLITDIIFKAKNWTQEQYQSSCLLSKGKSNLYFDICKIWILLPHGSSIRIK